MCAARIQLRDLFIADSRIEIVIGTKPGSLSGTVIDAMQKPAINETVVLVPDAARRRRSDAYRVTNTDASGEFHISFVPPGDYTAFAWNDVEDGAWQDPEFIRLYEERGTPVHIDESGKGNVALKAISSK